MNITVGGFYQGATDKKYAVKVLKSHTDVAIKAVCTCCGSNQLIKKMNTECSKCHIIGEWK